MFKANLVKPFIYLRLIHRSKALREYLGHQHFGYFVTVCAEAEKNCPRSFLFSANKHFHWYFDDPASVTGTDEEKLQKFREVRDQIEQRIQEWLAEQEISGISVKPAN